MITYQEAQQQIDKIEAEMKALGWWRSEPPPPEAYNFQQAFAMDTMTFSSWLQFIFIPKVREIIAKGGVFPRSSQVAAQAVREFDGVNEADTLIGLLSDFDAMIDRG